MREGSRRPPLLPCLRIRPAAIPPVPDRRCASAVWLPAVVMPPPTRPLRLRVRPATDVPPPRSLPSLEETRHHSHTRCLAGGAAAVPALASAAEEAASGLSEMPGLSFTVAFVFARDQQRADA